MYSKNESRNGEIAGRMKEEWLAKNLFKERLHQTPMSCTRKIQ